MSKSNIDHLFFTSLIYKKNVGGMANVWPKCVKNKIASLKLYLFLVVYSFHIMFHSYVKSKFFLQRFVIF